MAIVTVDVDDLEKIVFATAIIKSIESALSQRKQDPFIKPHLDYGEALERLATIARNARRADAGTLINFNEPLNKEELKLLREISSHEMGQRTVSIKEKLPEGGKAMSLVDQLAAKGCVQIGQSVVGVVWGGDSAPALKPHLDPERAFAVRVTPRGYEKLKDVS